MILHGAVLSPSTVTLPMALPVRSLSMCTDTRPMLSCVVNERPTSLRQEHQLTSAPEIASISGVTRSFHSRWIDALWQIDEKRRGAVYFLDLVLDRRQILRSSHHLAQTCVTCVDAGWLIISAFLLDELRLTKHRMRPYGHHARHQMVARRLAAPCHALGKATEDLRSRWRSQHADPSAQDKELDTVRQ